MPSRAATFRSHTPKPNRPKWRSLYGRQWSKYRTAFLSIPENVFCRECMKSGNEVIATQVDHIVAHRGDVELFWDPTNHQPLCESHHSQKTVREDGGFGRERKVQP